MRVVCVRQHGGPEVLKLEDLPRPELTGEDQVLVAMKAAALNHLDLWVRKGLPGVKLPMIPGSDGAGVVVDIGKGIKGLAAGDEVVIQPGTFCGQCPNCLDGHENLCPEYGILGETEDGVQAELVALRAANVFKKPSGLDFQEAASFGLVFLTAYQMLVKRARLEAGETVLIVGGSSGVGAAAIQIATRLGARVIATASKGRKTEFVKSMGAEEVVDHYEADWFKRVLDMAGSRKVQVVFEHVGSATWDQSMRTMGHGARLAVCGATTGAEVSINLRHTFRKHLSILGSTMGDLDTFQAVINEFEAGHYRAFVDRSFPMDKIAEAHAYLESGEHQGKVVITIPGGNPDEGS
ncbi:MAG: zinc-binding dehydrogenase [Fidelibacterota bacterium]|nr:MAG: zinc-binding dehydrogenase [Candidatus Neomarinimicrobiota bacterium]